MLSINVERVLDLSHTLNINALEIPSGWSVSVPTYIAALEAGECPSTLQGDVRRYLASVEDPAPAKEANHRCNWGL